MSGPVSVAEIEQALASADDRRLVRMVSAIDRMPSRGLLNRALDPLRPRLARLRPPRPLTLARIVTLPIETLLTPASAWDMGSTRIPRSHLKRMHDCLLAALPPELLAELAGRIGAEASMSDSTVVMAIGRQVWPACAQASEEALRSLAVSGGEGSGDMAGLRVSMKLTCRLLAIAEPLVDTTWHMPARPVIDFEEEQLRRVRQLMTGAAEHGRETLEHVLDLLVTLTDNPQLVLDTLLGNSLIGRGRDRDMAAAMLFERALAKADGTVRRLSSGEEIDAQDLAELVISTTATIQALESSSKDFRYDRRALLRVKADTVALVEARIGRLVEDVLLVGMAALPGHPRPELAVRRLEQTARATAQIRLAARPIGLATKIGYKMKEYFPSFRSIATATAEPLDFMDDLRIIEILYGSTQALQLYQAREKGERAPAATAALIARTVPAGGDCRATH